MKCDCGKRFDVRMARQEEYSDFKRVLDAGRHPAFIGRSTFCRNANNGGALIYKLDGESVAVSLINPHFGILLALNVIPAHRSHGLGSSIMKFLIPNFARVIEIKVPWFESLGYRKIGNLKQGQTLRTQIMARAELFDLAGKLQRLRKNRDDLSTVKIRNDAGLAKRNRRGRKTKVNQNV